MNLPSAGARRAAEAELRTLVDLVAPAQGRLVGALRRRLRAWLPAAHELVYEYRDCVVISFSPSGQGYEGVLAIRAGAEGVRLYFNRGKELPDPEKWLQGSGGLVRWMGVEGAATLARPAVVRLIEEAIARSRVPLARAGRGAVVIRPTAARRRRLGRVAGSSGGRDGRGGGSRG